MDMLSKQICKFSFLKYLSTILIKCHLNLLITAREMDKMMSQEMERSLMEELFAADKDN